MWLTGLRCRLRSCPGSSGLRAAGLAPRQVARFASQPLMDTSAEISAQDQAPRAVFSPRSPVATTIKPRKEENPPPPHLPLPPPLPYSPTSNPFLRHVQILDQSILSRSPDHSWEIFCGLHPDLYSALPLGTVSNLLRCQSQESRRPRRFIRLRQLLGIIREHKIRLRTSQLEQAVGVLIEAAQDKMDNEEIFETTIRLLCDSTGGRPEKVDPAVRQAWFEKAYRWQQLQVAKDEPRRAKQQRSILEWIRTQADKGYLRGLTLRAEYMLPRGRLPLIGQVLEPALDFCAYLLQHDLAHVVEASGTMIEVHLMGRAGSANMRVKAGNRGIEGFVRSVHEAGMGEVADSICRRSLAAVTGGVPEVASLFEIPSRLISTDIKQDLAQAQKTLQRCLARRSAYNHDHLGPVREVLAVSSLVIDRIVASRALLEHSFARSLFRLIMDGPFDVGLDRGYVDIKKAVLHAFRRLSTTDNLTRLPEPIQGDALRALLRFSSRRSDVDLFGHVYRQMVPRHSLPRSWKWSPESHEQFTQLIGSALDKRKPVAVTLAVELYVHWLSNGLPPFRPSVTKRLVHALSRLEDENPARRLLALHRGSPGGQARSIVVDLVRQAIADTKSEGVSSVYAEMIVEYERIGRRTTTTGTPGASSSDEDESVTTGGAMAECVGGQDVTPW
ncbi:hypothetical protein HD553DRAFT_305925 [Filobasidium floriforme]|uniref:uncharacterized protein n=1 Tax=Filobasidium floriforme TaxID=5210 RepID=UPI001E8DD28F|nr:uncharacterized protein HD553DRAFT_305925 [Filobasidium floriforme]KAH8089377.1 hypothetical protein HD553DRAFT_305925 [Filobasidium floriforme]